ncbi:MAG: DNA repair protein RecN [Candidatus Firestonebacteria bacterium]
MSLRELHIKNFALIDDLIVEFKNGFNVLTGETGAGKSIIIDAVNAILGERVNSDFVKTGENLAIVEGLFDNVSKEVLVKLEESGIYSEEDLIVKREIQREGKSKGYINNSLVTLATLKNIGEYLVDVHGQHEHQTLLNPINQLNLLDSFAKLEKMKENYKVIYVRFMELIKKKDSLVMSEQEKQRRMDIINFQIKEIETAKLKIGEDEELENTRNILVNSEKIATNVNDIYNLIYGDEATGTLGPSSLSNLQEALKKLQNLVSIDKSLEGVLKNLAGVVLELEEAAKGISDYKEKMDFNPAKLEEIEDRRDIIIRLKKKYGDSINSILEYYEKLKNELKEIIRNEEEIQKIEKDILEYKKELKKIGLELSEKRNNASKDFEKKVIKELDDLGMQKTRFKVEIKQFEKEDGLIEISGKRYEVYKDGLDKITFLISPNVGEELKPLTEIASGGELSRIMLALKIILGSSDKIPTLIFDEIDTGLGGNMGNVVGEKLLEVSKLHQVVCITHLPQIAGFADAHLFVKKEVKGNKTEVTLETLEKEGKIKEIARMLGGEDKEITIKHAKELLKK